MITCQRCQTTLVASRRQLFLCYMEYAGMPAGFQWYDMRAPAALPPKSLFVQLLAAVLILAIPTFLLLYSLSFTAESVLIGAAVLVFSVLACLLADLLVTHRRYRRWVSQCVCGNCRTVFVGDCNVLNHD